MKRLFALLAVMILSASCVVAEMPNFSEMTQEQVLDVINAGRNELVLKNTEEGLYKLETDIGITIVFTELIESSIQDTAKIEMIIINNSDIDYTVRANEIYINGWKLSGSSSSIKANRRMNASWFLHYDDANLSNANEIEDVELYISIYPENGSRKKDSIDFPSVIIRIK